MKIAYIVPGSGGTFYCGNCLRDKFYTAALRRTGHDIMMIPMDLPLGIDDCDADSPIFFGAVNVYLEQLSPLFKKAPHWLKHWLDSEKILGFAAKRSGSTRAVGNESMTISMLQGAQGKQAEDLEDLIDWLRHHEKPDIVHLSNALLTGLAKRIKEEVKCAVVCTLQDEDEWIDEMREPYAAQTWQLIEKNARSIDAFIAVSEYYKQLICNRIPTLEAKIHVVHNSVDPGILQDNTQQQRIPTIGYISKINSYFGADLLFDAFLELRKEEPLRNLRLKYSGGYTDDYRQIVKKIRQKVHFYNLHDAVSFEDDFSSAGKKRFFDSISLFCLPSRRKEAFAMHMLEACAAQVPAVMPDHGAYPELMKLTNAGLLYKPGNQQNLMDTLRKALTDNELYSQLQNNCHTGIREHFDNSVQTQKILSVYQQLI
jgi:glycosyltransferase involved in cell wall biosynthesis